MVTGTLYECYRVMTFEYMTFDLSQSQGQVQGHGQKLQDIVLDDPWDLHDMILTRDLDIKGQGQGSNPFKCHF